MMSDKAYKFPLFLAVSLHIIVLSLLFLQFEHHQLQVSGQSPVKIVHAVVVDPQQLINRQLQQKKIEQQRRHEEQLLRQREEQHKRELQRQHQLELQKLHQQQLRRRKALIAKRHALEVKKQQEHKQIEAKQAQHKLQHELQQQRKMEMQRTMEQQLQQEQQQMAAAAAQRRIMSLVDQYKAKIVQAISQRWIVPQNVKNISCKLLIDLAPGGTVLNVTLIQSSGNSVLDRSAQNAVWKASPLPVPTESSLFNYFREIRLTVRPENNSAGF